jgi:hypothetical protein
VSAPAYQLRWLTAAQLTRGVELYHLARTALALEADRSRCARLGWAAGELAKESPGLIRTAAYKDLEAAGVGLLYH